MNDEYEYLNALSEINGDDFNPKEWLIDNFELYKSTLIWPLNLPPINRSNMIKGTFREKFNSTYEIRLEEFEHVLNNENRTLVIKGATTKTTKDQTLQFLYYFVTSHSWYKHLNWEIPTDFVFFLDRNAWLQVDGLHRSSFLDDFMGIETVHEEERITLNETSETKKLQEKYGFWNFNGGRIRGLENEIESTFIVNENLEKELLSPDKLELGKIGLTALIHGSFRYSDNEEYKEKHLQEFEKLKNHLLLVLAISSLK